MRWAISIWFTLFVARLSYQLELHVSNTQLSLLINKTKTVDFILEGRDSVNIVLKPETENLVKVEPKQFELNERHANETVRFTGLSPGHVKVKAGSDNQSIIIEDQFILLTILNSYTWETVSLVIGWIYFVAWSVSFYPQIYENWKRKSVVGLNFDFIALNLTGFFLYSLFNLGLYCIPAVKTTYFARNPGGLIPVFLNDIVFSVHASFATILTIVQCFIYERDHQKISWTARIILTIYATIILVTIILSCVGTMDWLDFLYWCSYVKLSITLLKYLPQAYMNFKRKSTVGWSIGNVLLDFTGGILSMLQMIINSWNYDDWSSIFGDPTKFGLGLFSVVFDIFFFIQHYVLYKRTNYEEAPAGVVVNSRSNLVSQ